MAVAPTAKLPMFSACCCSSSLSSAISRSLVATTSSVIRMVPSMVRRSLACSWSPPSPVVFELGQQALFLRFPIESRQRSRTGTWVSLCIGQLFGEPVLFAAEFAHVLQRHLVALLQVVVVAASRPRGPAASWSLSSWSSRSCWARSCCEQLFVFRAARRRVARHAVVQVPRHSSVGSWAVFGQLLVAFGDALFEVFDFLARQGQGLVGGEVPLFGGRLRGGQFGREPRGGRFGGGGSLPSLCQFRW